MMKIWGHCLTLHLSPFWVRVHGSQFRVEYPGALSHLPARSNDQQTILHDETERTGFLTRLGQEILPQRWRSAKSSNDPITGRGVIGFGTFCRNKRTSPAGARPGNTENPVGTRVGAPVRCVHLATGFTGNPPIATTLGLEFTLRNRERPRKH
jgi:hypothetical protein